MPQSPTLLSLDHLVLTVADISATCDFYQSVLGMEAQQFVATDGTIRWALSYGSQKINLHEQGREFDPKALAPTPGSADLCFLTETPIAEWQTHFNRRGVEVEDGPVRRSGAAGPILSLYIRDPDANLIEVSELIAS